MARAPGGAPAAVLVVAAAWVAATTFSAEPARHEGDPAAGRKLFRVKCVACHKADGSGGVRLTGNPTPDWRDSTRMADPAHDDAYLRDCITNGKPKSGMPTWSKQGLKPEQIEDLIACIRTFAIAKVETTTKKKSGEPAKK